MIEIEVEMQDWDDSYSEKTVTIPSNIRAKLNRQGEYVITDCTPSIPGVQSMSVWDLEDVVNDINVENPSMTAELLSLIMNAVGGDLSNEEFVRRIKENDFVFRDLTDIAWKMEREEIAACYIATILKVPFDTGVTKEMLDFVAMDEITDYIDWMAIWEQYEAIGFKIAEDLESEEYNLYLVHWR